MATIENGGLKTKAAAEEDQYIFTVSAGITAETLFRKVSDGSLSKAGVCFKSGRVNSGCN